LRYGCALEADVKCIYCDVETGDKKSHATIAQCADALKRDVDRLIRQTGVSPYVALLKTSPVLEPS
jgi:hypothetical protein